MSARYLIARVGPYPLAIRAEAMVRIWHGTEARREAVPMTDRVDLRHLLGLPPGDPGIAIALQQPHANLYVLVDRIGSFVTLTDDEFIALPDVFAFARRFFDAAAKTAFDGGHALRLRGDLPPAADQAPGSPL